MELLRKLSTKFVFAAPLKCDELFYIGGSDTLPPPLKKEEEAELIHRLAEGDLSVKSILIERNLR